MMSIDRSKSGAMSVMGKRMFSLYYVIVPMLIITLILDNIGYRANAVVYGFSDYYILENIARPYSPAEIITITMSTLLYFNESWLFNILGVHADMGGVRAFGADPFWFMCYLISFSMLLVVARLVSRPRSIIVLILLCLVIGPPILLLTPLFLSGSLAYFIHKQWSGPDGVAV